MKFQSVVMLVVLACSAIPVWGQTGELHVRIVYGGPKAPEQKPVNVAAGIQFCGGLNISSEAMVVNPENKGLQNALLHVHTGSRGGIKLKEIPKSKGTVHLLDNVNCRFVPRVIAMQAGDTLRVKNSDPAGHNANLAFSSNDAVNPLLPPNSSKDFKLANAELGLTPVACNIHPWMSAFVMVLEHPFGGVSDKDGKIVIKDLPTEKLAFRFIHESVKSYDNITMNGKPGDWKRNVFEVTIKPGVNDLGDIVIPVANFQ